MYKDYLKERENKDVLETDKGFAVYLIQGEECYLVDIYVKPEHRRSRECYAITDEVVRIAKEKGCKYLTGSVDTRLPSATASLHVLLNYGMRLLKQVQDGLIFIKDI